MGILFWVLVVVLLIFFCLRSSLIMGVCFCVVVMWSGVLLFLLWVFRLRVLRLLESIYLIIGNLVYWIVRCKMVVLFNVVLLDMEEMFVWGLFLVVLWIVFEIDVVLLLCNVLMILNFFMDCLRVVFFLCMGFVWDGVVEGVLLRLLGDVVSLEFDWLWMLGCWVMLVVEELLLLLGVSLDVDLGVDVLFVVDCLFFDLELLLFFLVFLWCNSDKVVDDLECLCVILWRII